MKMGRAQVGLIMVSLIAALAGCRSGCGGERQRGCPREPPANGTPCPVVGTTCSYVVGKEKELCVFVTFEGRRFWSCP
jgi:hypothetical protein